MTDWLVNFFDNQQRIKCTACSDCDNERDAAEAEIMRLRHILSQSPPIANVNTPGYVKWKKMIEEQV